MEEQERLSNLQIAATLGRLATLALLRPFGFGYLSEIKIRGRTIHRPKHFGSQHHKKAFECVGITITDDKTRDLLYGFQDRSLIDPHNWYVPQNVPLTVWHDVLACFATQGALTRYWELRIPTYLHRPSFAISDWVPEEHMSVPYHGPRGESLERPAATTMGGEIAGSVPFWPGFLTDVQKQGLLGQPYRLHLQDARLQGLPPAEEQAVVILQERHFHCLYYRPREILL